MRLTRISTTLMTLLVAACSTDSSSSAAMLTSPGRAVLSNGAPNALTPVSLLVTVSDVDPSGAAYNIRSDGLGVYTDGSQNVQAVLDQYGTFAFNTPASTKRASQVRWLTYNFNSPVDPSNLYRPTVSNTAPHHISTGPSSLAPFIPLQNIGVSGNPTSECVYMGNSVANGTTTWRVSFHKGFEDVANSPTAYAVVTRTSVSPAVWTITSSGTCSPNANVAALRSSDSSVLYGYYNLPFRFTLSAK